MSLQFKFERSTVLQNKSASCSWPAEDSKWSHHCIRTISLAPLRVDWQVELKTCSQSQEQSPHAAASLGRLASAAFQVGTWQGARAKGTSAGRYKHAARINTYKQIKSGLHSCALTNVCTAVTNSPIDNDTIIYPELLHLDKLIPEQTCGGISQS